MEKYFRRILDCVKYVATQNLAFDGHVKSLTKNENPGNFLSLVKLLAKYDPTLNEHLELVTKKKCVLPTFLRLFRTNSFHC